MRSGAERIAAERTRQIKKHRWSAKHDDGHDDGSLVLAAVCYAAAAADERVYVREVFANSQLFRDPWPWSSSHDARPYHGNVLTECPSERVRIRLLEKAGALIAAELDRLMRAGEEGRSDG